MKKLIINYLRPAFILISLLAMCSSCMHSLVQTQKYQKNYLNDIHKSAVFVKIKIGLEFCATKEQENCKRGELESSGSGFVIKTTDKGTYIGTAAHVCSPESELPFIFLFFFKDKEIKIKNIEGEEYSATLVNTDIKNDLCLMFVKGLTNKPINIAKIKPIIGERIYHFGYPKGIYLKGLTHKFEGFYTGDISIDDKHPDFLKAAFSVYVMGGSSGSMIINKRGELIGVVQSGLTTIDMFMMSSTFETTTNFYIKSLAKAEK